MAADPVVLALGAAVVGALVNQVFTTVRDIRAERRGEGRAAESREHRELLERLGRIEDDVRGVKGAVADVREKQAGITALVDYFVVPGSSRDPRRGR